MIRPKISFFKKLVYLPLYIAVHLVGRIFYSKIEVINKDGLKLDRPTILVSNHPSTMMDPVNVAARVNRYVHFLANAGLFQTAFTNWFFGTFFCIPVQRKKDKGKRRFDNDKSFDKSFEFLKSGGCLYIAAEGVSTPEHDLKKLKSGTARISLGAEKEFDNELNLQILPIGLYYESAQVFNRPLLINVGEPVVPKNWSAAFKKDERKAAEELTAMLQEKTEELLVNVDGPEQDFFFRRVEEMVNFNKPKELLDQFKRSKLLAQATREALFESTGEKVNQLIQLLEEAKFSISAIFGKIKIQWWHFLAPFAIVGFVTNIVPAVVVSLIRRAANIYRGYDATIYVLMGIIFFPIAYRLNNYLLGNFFEVGYYWPLFWLGYVLLGRFAHKWIQSVHRGLERLRWQQFGSKSQKGKEILRKKNEILDELTPYI